VHSFAVLDGIHRLDTGTLTVRRAHLKYFHVIQCLLLQVLQRLVQDRHIVLHDGTQLIPSETFKHLQTSLNLTDQQLADRKILKIHPNFRIVALGGFGRFIAFFSFIIVIHHSVTSTSYMHHRRASPCAELQALDY
jgi:hypothetical protein